MYFCVFFQGYYSYVINVEWPPVAIAKCLSNRTYFVAGIVLFILYFIISKFQIR